jgi:hypothetical protein
MAYALSVSASNSEFEEMGTSLSEMQGVVGGLIEPIDLTPSLTMWVNEEFLYMPELEVNVIGSSFFHLMAGGEYAIHGNVIFTGGTGEDGEILDLGSKEASLIKEMAIKAYTTLQS